MSNTDRGMVAREAWERTDVHKASQYFCGKCGQQFPMPHDLYEHLDREHPRPKRVRKDYTR